MSAGHQNADHSSRTVTNDLFHTNKLIFLICENKLICELANKTILANKLIFSRRNSILSQISLSSPIALFIVLFARNKVSAGLKNDQRSHRVAHGTHTCPLTCIHLILSLFRP
jgi:hypothetical protein